MVMRPIYTAFFTRNTLYEQEVARLRTSLDLLGLPHDIRGIASAGDWRANTQLTVQHILTMMDAYPDRPIVQLDADAIVMRMPTLFEDGIDCDVAGHFRRGHELLNGTLYIAPTAGARLVMEKYRDGVAAHPEHRNEQHWLQVAVEELRDVIRWGSLPPEYCWIPDIMRDDLPEGVAPIVQHHQASREVHDPNGVHLAARRKWIERYEADFTRAKAIADVS
jgi:hypothetical protein